MFINVGSHAIRCPLYDHPPFIFILHMSNPSVRGVLKSPTSNNWWPEKCIYKVGDNPIKKMIFNTEGGMQTI